MQDLADRAQAVGTTTILLQDLINYKETVLHHIKENAKFYTTFSPAPRTLEEQYKSNGDASWICYLIHLQIIFFGDISLTPWQLTYYSEQQNWFMKGQILLVSQIMAQGTKIKPWEIVVTKIGLLFTIKQNYRTLVFVNNLISILQSSHLGESVLLPAPPLGFIMAPIPLGMLLIRFLWTSWHKLSIASPPTPIAHIHQQEGPIYAEVLHGVL